MPAGGGTLLAACLVRWHCASTAALLLGFEAGQVLHRGGSQGRPCEWGTPAGAREALHSTPCAKDGQAACPKPERQRCPRTSLGLSWCAHLWAVRNQQLLQLLQLILVQAAGKQVGGAGFRTERASRAVEHARGGERRGGGLGTWAGGAVGCFRMGRVSRGSRWCGAGAVRRRSRGGSACAPGRAVHRRWDELLAAGMGVQGLFGTESRNSHGTRPCYLPPGICSLSFVITAASFLGTRSCLSAGVGRTGWAMVCWKG